MREEDFTTDEIRDGFASSFALTTIARAEFDRWLESIKAKIWYEGFDAGEQDVWEHQHGEAGWDSECIKNPYLKEDETE